MPKMPGEVADNKGLAGDLIDLGRWYWVGPGD